jgi:hypothetical protein
MVTEAVRRETDLELFILVILLIVVFTLNFLPVVCLFTSILSFLEFDSKQNKESMINPPFDIVFRRGRTKLFIA